MKCLEAAAGRPSGAEQIQGGGRLAVNYAAILPGNLQPGAVPQARGKPGAKAISPCSGCWEAMPRATPPPVHGQHLEQWGWSISKGSACPRAGGACPKPGSARLSWLDPDCWTLRLAWSLPRRQGTEVR